MTITLIRTTNKGERRHERGFEINGLQGLCDFECTCPTGLRRLYRALTGKNTVPKNCLTFNITRKKHAGSIPINYNGDRIAYAKQWEITSGCIDQWARDNDVDGNYHISLVEEANERP